MLTPAPRPTLPKSCPVAGEERSDQPIDSWGSVRNAVPGTIVGVNKFDRLLDSKFGWIIPGGAPYKLGRKDGTDSTLRGSWLIWGVWGERMYDRGRRQTVAEKRA